MCGRYQLSLAGGNELFRQRFSIDGKQKINIKDNYNIAPSQLMPVVVKHNLNNIQMMLWGLIPSWSKDGKSLVINARAESVSIKPMFKLLTQKQRCLVPSTGFYEWKKTTEGKKPYYIGLKNHDLFSFAGLYDVWKNPQGEEIYSYVIITCNPNKTMLEIHNRMPAILRKEQEEKWLDPNILEQPQLLSLLNPLPDDLMTAYPISTRINSPIYNDSSVDKPIKTTLFD